ncbi:MAG: hypothetical protein K6T71_01225 [Candidatus Bipolaricaulota bacterium]|nr:hypothetical protein [Candidatus Bipolaricaulota bacterium]
MFRRITVLASALALALAGALSWTAAAAPITGSFSFDVVFYPQQACTVNDDFEIVCEDPINKIDRILVKFEADLLLTMSISGLELTSSTSFTFKGIETQIFWAKATVGAMVFETAMVFAPNIMEFEEVRSGSGTRYYCLSRSAPDDYGDASGPSNSNNCNSGSSAGILDPVYGYNTWGDMLILGYSPIANLIVGRWADGEFDFWHTPNPNVTGSMLDQPLTFRKKAAEVTLSIAGLTLGLRGLFANFGTTTTPNFVVGTVLVLEGTTVSGIKVRSETWVGARQGFECFGECKPNQRLGTQGGFIFVPYPATGGIVVPGFEPQEEKLYITGLRLAGLTHSIVIEMQLAGAAADSRQPTFVAIQTSTPRITPLGISVTNIARFDRGFERFLRDQVVIGVSFGEASGSIIWDFRPNAIGAWETLLTVISAEFDAPGATASVTLVTCDPDAYVGVGRACNINNFLNYGSPSPFIEVYYDLLFEVGDMTVYIYVDMFGSLLKDLYGFGVDAQWTLGPVTISSSTAFRNLQVERRSWNEGNANDLFEGTRPELAYQQFLIELKF